MSESFSPSTLLPAWFQWTAIAIGILLIVWPYLFRRKPKGMGII